MATISFSRLCSSVCTFFFDLANQFLQLSVKFCITSCKAVGLFRQLAVLRFLFADYVSIGSNGAIVVVALALRSLFFAEYA